MRFVIVGGGMQGRVIARNLIGRSEKPEVIVADLFEPKGLPANAKFRQANILEPSSAAQISKGADAIILAVPSQIAREALANILPHGVPVVDVSFTETPPIDLSPVAQKAGTCCIVDCGVAPGLSHILVGCAYTELGGLDSVRILVGGMPQSPPTVFRHAIYFNPNDLLAEYIRPARARREGKDIAPDPLVADVETMIDEELGPLEAFLSDGLRSLLTSYPEIKTMNELTLRWPGHLETMRNLREMGMFAAEETVGALAMSLAQRYPAEDFKDVLLMVVEATKGKEVRRWRLLDRKSNDESAMSRTTGYTTAAVAMLLAKKQFTEPGVHPPERLGTRALADEVVRDLAGFGVKVAELTANKVG